MYCNIVLLVFTFVITVIFFNGSHREFTLRHFRLCDKLARTLKSIVKSSEESIKSTAPFQKYIMSKITSRVVWASDII